MDKLEKMDWNPHFSVDIDEIDAYQKKMFSLLNDLINLKKNQVDTKEYTNKVSQINDFGKLYFNSEEKLYLTSDYPDKELHSEKHNEILQQLGDFQNEFEKGNRKVDHDFLEFIKEWLQVHIMSIDKSYRNFI